ncbi:MAG: RidA family protein, partial [Chitinophagaceae bacterium]|nr:RidA family protein [Chitinophagaceae bacterium]
PDHGVGVRSAVGMSSLPGNIPVEIEAVFELTD